MSKDALGKTILEHKRLTIHLFETNATAAYEY